MLSAKLFNDAVTYGYVDILASSMDVAVRAMSGGPPLSCLLDNDMIPLSNIMRVLESPYIDGVQIGGILAGPGLRADRAQAILYQLIDDGYYDKVVGALTYGAPSATITSNTTLTAGINRYNYLSVASGVTLTLGAGPGILIANTISNLGTIASGWTCGAGGAAATSGAGAGGAGCGAVIILARSITVGTITSNGAAGGDGSVVTASSSGGAGGAGNFWLISGDSVPNGGTGGYHGGAGNPNGGGGGGPSSTYKGGDGGSATTTTYSTGLGLLTELLKATVDWWLVNVAGKTPTTTKSIPSLGGSGGGGGGARDTYGAGGGGGGGGGQIIIYSASVTAGTVQARGGAGGNGGTEGSYDAGGGGGGGGIIYVFYKSLSGSFTYDVSGGAGGTGDYAGAAGGTGVFRAIAV
jgi:hypothetical protein